MSLRPWMLFILLFALLFALSCATGSDDDNPNPPNRFDDDDVVDPDLRGDDDDALCPDVIREYLTIDSFAAPPNPITGDQTPEQYNKVKYFRYRADTGENPPAPADAIVILLPGYTVGVGYLAYTAQNLVALSCGRVEVWLMERRHHLLEDTHGMNVAEAAKDPDIAVGYYFEGKPVQGKTFDGFLDAYGPETGFLSEWGMDVAMQDIRTLIEQVPESARQQSVFLAGHSRGGAYVKAYGAYVFEDGHQGCDDVAGLILVDGESRYLPVFTESIYRATINAIRRGWLPRYMTFPPLGPPIYTYMEILALAASSDLADTGDPRLGPDGVFGNFGPMKIMVPLMYRYQDLTLTNEAFWGYATDTESGLIGLLTSSVGKLDGPTATDFLGVYPTDPNHVYRWKHYDEVSPTEYCEIQDFIHGLYEGPSNAMDPYYATRLDVDFYAAGILETDGQWQADHFLLRNSEMDAPVFLLGSHLLSEMSGRIDLYRDQLPPVRGQSLPRDQFGFDILWRTDWEHIDTAFAVAETNEFFAVILEWIKFFSEGSVQVPTAGE